MLWVWNLILGAMKQSQSKRSGSTAPYCILVEILSGSGRRGRKRGVGTEPTQDILLPKHCRQWQSGLLWGNSELGQLPYIDRGILNLISKGLWVETLDSTKQRGVSSLEICVASEMIQRE